jgi:hypothetical protein
MAMRSMLTVAVVCVAAVALAGCEEAEPTWDPRNSTSWGMYGLSITRSLVADTDDKVHVQARILSGDAGEILESASSVRFVESMTGCKFPTPANGEKVVHLAADGHDSLVNLYAYSAEDVHNAAKQFVTRWLDRGREPQIGSLAEGLRYKKTNVILTDTSAPLHVVLSSKDRVIYNFQIGPGVTVAGVSVIVGGQAGVANLPASVKLSFLDAPSVKLCAAHPVRRPRHDWNLARYVRDGDRNFAAQMDRVKAAHEKFNAYFLANFGVGSEERIVSGERIGNYLVGPIPKDMKSRPAYKPVAASEIRMTRPEHFFAGPNAEFEKQFAGQVRKAAEPLAGGNLASLNRK